jgi:hypothetical protein
MTKTVDEAIEAALSQVRQMLDQMIDEMWSELIAEAGERASHPECAAVLQGIGAQMQCWRAARLAEAERKLREAARPYESAPFASLH